MTDGRTIERLLANVRAQVAELRRLENERAEPRELEERKRLIARLQSHLAACVRASASETPVAGR